MMRGGNTLVKEGRRKRERKNNGKRGGVRRRGKYVANIIAPRNTDR